MTPEEAAAIRKMHVEQQKADDERRAAALDAPDTSGHVIPAPANGYSSPGDAPGTAPVGISSKPGFDESAFGKPAPATQPATVATPASVSGGAATLPGGNVGLPVVSRGGTAKPAASGGVRTGPAPLSIDEQWLVDSGKVSQSDIDIWHAQGKTSDEIEDIYLGKRMPTTNAGPGAENAGARYGGVIERTAELEKIRQAQDEASAAQIQLQSQHALNDATESASKRVAEAQELRNEKPDPQHWFKERGTAGSILAAIAMGAGAFGAAITHSPNFAMDIINKSIDRDIDAQTADLDNKWKALNFKGSEDDKKFVKEQWMINQKNNARLVAWDHATALIDQTWINAGAQAKAVGYQAMKTEAELHVNAIKQGMIDQRHLVLVKEAAAKAAAGAADPFSAQNTTKAYMTYRSKAEAANLEHPDKPVAIMSRDEWLPSYRGQGAPAPAASGLTGGAVQQSAVASAKEVIRINDRIGQILGDPVYANSPKGRAELDQLSAQGALHWPRLQSGSTRINTPEYDAGKEAYSGGNGWLRLDILGRTAITLKTISDQALRVIQGGGVSGASDNEVPGATPVGE